jgi:DNA-binding transcriptional LysR family regulator
MKLNDIDLNKLVIFSSVAKHGGYKGASEDLNLTRSAISQAVTNLEDVLGKKLFHRIGTKLQLTEEALRFHQEFLQYQSQLQQSLSTLTHQTQKVEGQLRIGAYLEFTKSKLMPVIEDFVVSHPRAQMKFTFDSPSRIQSLLEQDKIDLSISIFPHEGIKSIESQRLYQEELVLIGHSDVISRQPKKDQLAVLPVIDYYPMHLLFKRWWKCQFSQPLREINVVMYAGTAEMVYEMVKRRLGIGVIPRYILDRGPQDERIQVIQPTSNRLVDYVWLNQFKAKDRKGVHAEFLKILFERFRQ